MNGTLFSSRVGTNLRRLSNVGRSDSHIHRHDSFISKTIRFVRAPQYRYVADAYDKWSIIITIFLLLVSFVTFVIWAVFDFPKLKYVDKNGKDLKGLNLYFDIQSYTKMALMTASFFLTIMHIRELYKYNDFRSKTTLSGIAPFVE